MTEHWEEFEDGYWVSDLGRVKNEKRLLKQSVRGSVIYRIDNDTRVRSVAMLVAENFVRMPQAGCKAVRHKDGDPTNNRADNLEWIVKAEKPKSGRKPGRPRKEEKDADLHRRKNR